MGNIGIKVSRGNQDVLTASPQNLAFSSKFDTFSNVAVGTVTISFNGEAAGTVKTTSLVHSLGYAPAVLVFASDGSEGSLAYPSEYQITDFPTEFGVDEYKLYFAAEWSGSGNAPSKTITFKYYVFNKAMGSIPNIQLAGWQMNEGSGTTVADETGNGHTLTFAAGGSAPAWSTDTDDGSAYSLSFDGGDYASAPDSPLHKVKNAFTFETRFKVASFDAVNQDTIMQKGRGDTFLQFYMQISLNKKILGGFYDGSNWKEKEGSTILSADTWYRGKVTFDIATGELNVYINNVLEGTLSGITTMPVGSSGNIEIGGTSYDAGKGLNGKVDAVKIYNYVV